MTISRSFAGAALILGVCIGATTANAAPRCPNQGGAGLGDGGITVVVECPGKKPPTREPVPVNNPLPAPTCQTSLVDPGNGNVVLIGECLGGQIVRPIPPPPGSVFAQVPIPATQVNTMPTEENLVGWRTELWYTNPGTVVAEVELTDANGLTWVGEARAKVVRYTWHMDSDSDYDGDKDVRVGTRPGTADNPSATYVYQYDCQCTITVVATWSGTYTLTEATTGTTYTNVSLGEHDFPTTAPYTAIEVQAIITR